jgi:hypothetical protein
MSMEDYKKRKLEETKQSLGATRDFEPMFPSSFTGALKTLDDNTAKPIRYATNEAIKTGKPWEFFKGLAKSVTEEIPDVSGKEIASNLGLSTKEYLPDQTKPMRYSGSGISESPFKASPAGMVGFGLENLLDAENLMPVGKAMAVGGLALGGLKKVGKELGEGVLEGGLKKTKAITDNPNFKNWFGDSKVVDKEGKPLVVYHGTGADFDVFYQGKNGEIHLSANPSYANAISQYKGKGGNVMPSYVNAKNPRIINESDYNVDAIQSAKDAGHDALFVNNKNGLNNIVVFDNKQIKSATGNRGTFDPKDPNILKGLAPVGPWMLYQQQKGEE